MKKVWKNYIAVFMAVITMFFIFGCKREEDTVIVPSQEEIIFQATDFSTEGMEGEISSAYVQNGRFYVITYDWSEQGLMEGSDEASMEKLYSVNPDGSDLREISYPQIGEVQEIQSIAVGQDGNMLFLVSCYDSYTDEFVYFLIKIDEDGNELSRKNISEMLSLSDDSYISKMIIDEQDRVILVEDSSVYIMNENLNYEDTIEVNSPDHLLVDVAKAKNGQLLFAMDVESGIQVKVFDVEKKEWMETYDLSIAYLHGNLMDGIEYDFYYADASGVYGYDRKEKQAVRIMDYVASNIVSENLYSMIPVASDKCLGVVLDDDYGMKLVVYQKIDASSMTEKEVITYGVLQTYRMSEIQKQVMEFNKNSDTYQIEIKDYSTVEKLNTDIIAGKIPDIISLYGLSYEQYISKGMLEDLTPYFEKDEQLDTSDIIDSVRDAMQVDGRIYYIAPSFGISTIVARTSDVGNGTGWTFDELKNVLEEKGDSARPFYSENKTEMLSCFLKNGLNDFVDWKTGECQFESQDFRDILEICNRGTDEETRDDEDLPNMTSLIREGKILFLEDWIYPEQVQYHKKMFGEAVTYIGYPNEERQGAYFQFSDQLAIYSGSEVKEGAWEFIRHFMTFEYQGNPDNVYEVPTRKDCFDMMMKAKMTTEEYTDELGQIVYPLNGEWGVYDFEINLAPLSQEEANQYVNLVKNTRKVGNSDDVMMGIILEDAAGYFAGDKSLDETVKIIQNRIKTYVNENR